MGIAGACANYFFDDFSSALLFLPRTVLTCADGQDIGAVPVELALADAGDAREVARFADLFLPGAGSNARIDQWDAP